MIKYALRCDRTHEFEGWFGSSADYDDQAARGLVECPVCGSTGVSKQIMAPAVAGTQGPAVHRARRRSQDARDDDDGHGRGPPPRRGKLRLCRRRPSPRRPRAIHEGSSEERGIYGEASPAEVKALVEDGVKVVPLPPGPPKKTDVN
ncbi:DUF1178 family protein [Caulobacter vibrioides]|uniref:DUF1178 family protein n=1 Tax=Caulobacter vibrioides TaxID=155892 RepID=UPI001E5A5954|nr:DUF1178 family protein [Caulobacter vibrioides]